MAGDGKARIDRSQPSEEPACIVVGDLRKGEYAASGHVSISGPLSDDTKIMVCSYWPVSFSRLVS